MGEGFCSCSFSPHLYPAAHCWQNAWKSYWIRYLMAGKPQAIRSTTGLSTSAVSSQCVLKTWHPLDAYPAGKPTAKCLSRLYCRTGREALVARVHYRSLSACNGHPITNANSRLGGITAKQKIALTARSLFLASTKMGEYRVNCSMINT
jgi:hypothetical protein